MSERAIDFALGATILLVSMTMMGILYLTPQGRMIRERNDGTATTIAEAMFVIVAVAGYRLLTWALR